MLMVRAERVMFAVNLQSIDGTETRERVSGRGIKRRCCRCVYDKLTRC